MKDYAYILLSEPASHLFKSRGNSLGLNVDLDFDVGTLASVSLCSILMSELLLLQAIAAMMRAQEVDPTNLEVLLALGVSHTNG